MSPARGIRAWVSCLCAAAAPCQRALPLDVDPYTAFDPAAMRMLGYVAAGPFALGDGYGTDAVEAELGTALRWIETGHFRIGSTLAARPWPEDRARRRLLLDECRRLHGRCPRLPARPRQLDGWLQVHLFAQRLEDLFADFARRVGPDAEGELLAATAGFGYGEHFGCREKFVVLLFERTPELARFLGRFCGRRDQRPWSQRFRRTDGWMLATAAGALDGRLRDPVELHGHVVHATAQTLLDAFAGRDDGVPAWWRVGIAHGCARAIDAALIEAQGGPIGRWRPEQWPEILAARLQKDLLPDLREVLQWPDLDRASETEHAVAWSLSQYLLEVHGDEGFGRFVRLLREKPKPPCGTPGAQVLAWHEAALRRACGLDLDGLATAWREYVRRGCR